MIEKHPISFVDLGNMAYAEAMAKQFEHANAIRYPHRDNTELANGSLIVVEHPPTITLGRRGIATGLLANSQQLQKRGVELFTIKRGGDATFHGPGQLVVYPILPLRKLKLNVKQHVCHLENIMVATCKDFGVPATTSKEANQPTGVWVEDRKIGQIGVHVSRGITTHGLALNVCMDLSYFDLIVPCGISGCKVTSIEKEGQKNEEPTNVDLSLAKEKLLKHFANAFRISFG